MNPNQRRMCRGLLGLMAELFADPNEERKYQEWLAKREKRGAAHATNENRATPQITAASV